MAFRDEIKKGPPACGKCLYYQASTASAGSCHYHPPQLFAAKSQPAKLFPAVSAGDWCGKFEARKKDVAVPVARMLLRRVPRRGLRPAPA